MFSFFSRVLAKVVAVVTAIFVSAAPATSTTQTAVSAPVFKVVSGQEVIVQEAEKPKPITPAPKKQVEAPQPATPVATIPEPAKPKTFVTPTGAIVDEAGNILNPDDLAKIQAEAQRQLQIQEVQAARDRAPQIKQEKLNVINQKIAALNAKYAADIAEAYNRPGETIGFSQGEMNKITTEYNIAYATLKAEFQQIQYSN